MQTIPDDKLGVILYGMGLAAAVVVWFFGVLRGYVTKGDLEVERERRRDAIKAEQDVRAAQFSTVEAKLDAIDEKCDQIAERLNDA